MATSNIERYLESFAKQVVKDAKKNLAESKGDTELSKSIKFRIKQTSNGIRIQFLMSEYGDYVDKGVKGAGGEIKSGEHKGKWGGRRWYTTWEGKRKDSPFQFGSGKGKKNGIYKGIGSFIRKKGLQPRSEGGQFMTTVGLKIAIAKVIWIKGIHGISFFQNSLRKNYSDFAIGFLAGLKEDILQSITVNKRDI